MTVRFRITGTDLPGLSCGPSPTPSGRNDNIHVAVQRGQEPVQLARGDAESVSFEFDVNVRNGRFTGPYVHGRGDERFIYLMWGSVNGGGFEMFRRAKLRLDGLDAAAAEGRTVAGAVGLTDPKGHPTCASVRPAWTVL